MRRIYCGISIWLLLSLLVSVFVLPVCAEAEPTDEISELELFYGYPYYLCQFYVNANEEITSIANDVLNQCGETVWNFAEYETYLENISSFSAQVQWLMREMGITESVNESAADAAVAQIMQIYCENADSILVAEKVVDKVATSFEEARNGLRAAQLVADSIGKIPEGTSEVDWFWTVYSELRYAVFSATNGVTAKALPITFDKETQEIIYKNLCTSAEVVGRSLEFVEVLLKWNVLRNAEIAVIDAILENEQVTGDMRSAFARFRGNRQSCGIKEIIEHLIEEQCLDILLSKAGDGLIDLWKAFTPDLGMAVSWASACLSVSEKLIFDVFTDNLNCEEWMVFSYLYSFYSAMHSTLSEKVSYILTEPISSREIEDLEKWHGVFAASTRALLRYANRIKTYSFEHGYILDYSNWVAHGCSWAQSIPAESRIGRVPNLQKEYEIDYKTTVYVSKTEPEAEHDYWIYPYNGQLYYSVNNDGGMLYITEDVEIPAIRYNNSYSDETIFIDACMVTVPHDFEVATGKLVLSHQASVYAQSGLLMGPSNGKIHLGDGSLHVSGDLYIDNSAHANIYCEQGTLVVTGDFVGRYDGGYKPNNPLYMHLDKANVHVQGDVVGGTWNGGEGTLRIEGSASYGIWNVESGNMIIGGTVSGGTWNMEQSGGYLLVCGDIEFSDGTLTDGVMEVKGDCKISRSDTPHLSTFQIPVEKPHRTIISGTGQQIVQGVFAELELQNKDIRSEEKEFLTVLDFIGNIEVLNPLCLNAYVFTESEAVKAPQLQLNDCTVAEGVQLLWDTENCCLFGDIVLETGSDVHITGAVLAERMELSLLGDSDIVIDKDMTFVDSDHGGGSISIAEGTVSILGAFVNGAKDKYGSSVKVSCGSGTLTVQGDFDGKWNTISVNSGNMIIGGYTSSGTWNVQSGKVTVNGSVSGGTWNMDGELGQVLVYGDFEISSADWSAGTLEVKGDCITTFYITVGGTHTTILSGTEQQIVEGAFANIELKNNDIAHRYSYAVYPFDSYIKAEKFIGEICSINPLQLYNYTFTQNQTIITPQLTLRECTVETNTTLSVVGDCVVFDTDSSKATTLNGTANVNVSKNIFLYGSLTLQLGEVNVSENVFLSTKRGSTYLRLNNGKFNVQGDLLAERFDYSSLRDVEIFVGNGELNIAGNYDGLFDDSIIEVYVQSGDFSVNGNAEGCLLFMRDEQGYARVAGDFFGEEGCAFVAGVFEVQGNCAVKSIFSESDALHRTVINGEGEQIVSGKYGSLIIQNEKAQLSSALQGMVYTYAGEHVSTGSVSAYTSTFKADELSVAQIESGSAYDAIRARAGENKFALVSVQKGTDIVATLRFHSQDIADADLICAYRLVDGFMLLLPVVCLGENTFCNANEDGMYVVSLTPLVQYGDANMDGRCSLLDTLMILKAAINETIPADRAAADINGDAKIDIQDVLLSVKLSLI